MEWGILMAEKNLPVTDNVYDAVLDLQRRLQEVYGSDVSISDTIDFLGHQLFVHNRLLDIASVQLNRMAEERGEPGLMDRMLGAFGMNMPKDSTCFIRTNIEVPPHWISTRWLLDVEGTNILKCLSESQETKKKKSGIKINIL